MNHHVTIELALFLSFLDVENLGKGFNTKLLPRVPLEAGQKFLLYPVFPETLGLEDCKNLPIIDYLNHSVTIDKTDTVLLQYYAECQILDNLHTPEEIQQLALEQNWLPEALQELYKSRGNLNLSVASVQVYQLPQPVLAKCIQTPKLGKFLGLRLLNLDSQLKIENTIAVVPLQSKANKSWIKTIAELGNRSNEDTPKSSYQAGTDFENITRKSLEFLGFTVEEAYRGGAGGLDVYCSKPYPLVLECKSGKSIPVNTVRELINLGGKHLSSEHFQSASKLIIAPSKPTSHTLKSSLEWNISIMKPETLEKLVQLKATYPGAIDLLKLKEYLQPGQIDEKIQDLIDRIEEKLSIRRQIIQAVKDNYPDTHTESIRLAYKLKYKPKQSLPDLKNQEIRDILIELSSPLTGYLGRETDERGDRFYYQRDLAPLSSAKQ